MTRAEWLGSTFATVKVGCACGTSFYVERSEWEERGEARCPDCGCFVNYRSLRVSRARGAPPELEKETRGHA